jgi:hypothetical protein
MFIAALLYGMIATAPVIGYDPVGNYYDRLKFSCEDATNAACCRASVREMRKQNARIAAAGLKCPVGFRRVSLRCPSSYNWCSYKAWTPDVIDRSK